jgi:hypothetical protein
VVEAGVALAGTLGSGGVGACEVVDHRRHRAAQTVQVEAIKAGALRHRTLAVDVAQRVDERHDIGVAPHPGRKAPEAGERVIGREIVAEAAHETVDAMRVGPVAFHRHGVEAVFLDQATRDRGTLGVELVRAVRGFADQYEAGVADQCEQGVVVVGAAGQRPRVAPHRVHG